LNMRESLLAKNKKEDEMSIVRTEKITCPKCHYLQDTPVWHSVNVSLDPTLRERLFNGEINLFTCTKCGKRATIDVPLLYHDMTRKYCVQYYPPKSLEDPKFVRELTSEKKADNPTKLPASKAQSLDRDYLSRPHIVFDMHEMVRYIMFRDLVFDRLN
jgi:hypothetical protein